MRKFFLFAAALCCAVMTSATEGALPGKFSVAADKQVYFSQGNLRATTENKGESWTWSFATNQWDFVGNQVANNAISGNGKVSTNGTVDLFGWSTKKTYYGIHNSTNAGDYDNGICEDWGNNPISNGGNQPKLWRTLTNDEWVYLFQTREDAANKYGAAKVNDIPGVVFLPDVWTLPSGLEFTPGKINGAAQYDWSTVASTNIYDINQWPAMEAAGAVFLPTTGLRYGTEVSFESVGYYWSSTDRIYGKQGKWYFFGFNSPDDILPNLCNESSYSYGQPVRLVIDVDSAEGIEEVPSSLQGGAGGRLILRDGILLIEKNGKLYNAQGAQVK